MTETAHRAAAGKFAPSAWALPVAVAALAIVAVVVVAAVDPHEAGHYPTCPTLYFTGLWCPGGGSLRAIYNLAHGNLTGALGMNILTVIAVPYLAWRWGRWLAESLSYPVRRRVAPTGAIWALLAVIVGFAITRNIPALAPWLAP